MSTDLDFIGITVEPKLSSVITCPDYGATSQEETPINACIYLWECKSCGKLLRPVAGDCCVVCSFGSVKCPPMQLEKGRYACRANDV